MRLGKRGVVFAVAVGALIVGGVSYATIPDSSGVIHTCYSQATGTWRPIDTETNPPQKCKSGEKPLNLNQSGPSGHSGPSGPSGASGASGPSGPSGLAASQIVDSFDEIDCPGDQGPAESCTPGDAYDAFAACPTGTILLGGGGYAQGESGLTPDFFVASSTPAAGGWTTIGLFTVTDTTHTYAIHAFAVCSA